MPSGDFAVTRWSVVLRARDEEATVAHAALSDLCQAYWYPLYAFARRSGCAHHEAEDLTQGLFADLIRRDSLATANPNRGRFRSFLLGAMKHHMADMHTRRQAEKRGGGVPTMSLNADDGDARYAAEPADPAPPDVYFDHRWANVLLQRTLVILEAEYTQAGKQAVFDALRGHIIHTPAGACEDAAGRLAINEGHVRVLAHRLRRRFAELLRQQVADTVGTATDVDDELRHLVACLAGAA
ncbi:MAG: sigma-70 family RNA polymerase sigma factor [Lentisphaerae bacterium]|nr:sigma-70 family RNA polymerase sigma factor [Lentisphaerota bacterium]